MFCLGSMSAPEVEFAVHPKIWRSTTRAHEQLRLRDGRVGDTVVRHVDATDNDNGLSRQVRDDVLHEFSSIPNLC